MNLARASTRILQPTILVSIATGSSHSRLRATFSCIASVIPPKPRGPPAHSDVPTVIRSSELEIFSDLDHYESPAPSSRDHIHGNTAKAAKRARQAQDMLDFFGIDASPSTPSSRENKHSDIATATRQTQTVLDFNR
ncbi:uncharacterized protein BKA78DRAFT_296998 [Phyllosticta capitalensis]|uniref:uncharacterized protein n=1 Tax=Phyllosticta capitalensis TaxID=121624 RepID=UPI00312DDEE3